ncbi:MAG: response regulator [Candidatus Thiodiazotropha sp.]
MKLSDKADSKQPDIDDAQPSLQEHILIVDDESEISELLEEIPTSTGLVTIWVNSGCEALDWLGDHRRDILPCDIRMPDMDGPALWRVLQQNYPELAARTAFTTGDTLSASISPCLRATARPWLEKPFNPEHVLELVAGLNDQAYTHTMFTLTPLSPLLSLQKAR